jgi:hypothetical protein
VIIRPLFGLVALLSVSLFACSGDDPSAEGPAAADSGFLLPWSEEESWFLVGGPHCDSAGDECDGQPRYALDFAPVAPMFGDACRPGALEPYWVTAAAAGAVRIASASLVEVEHEDGRRTGYYHLLTASLQVVTGDNVAAGDRLGHPSCEHLRGGGSRGAHVHFYICSAGSGNEGCLGDYGLALPIEGVHLSGWRVAESDANYEGTLQRGGDTRVAVNLRCDGSDAASPECAGLRNDISSGPQ